MRVAPNVKDKSVPAFLEEKLLGNKSDSGSRIGVDRDISPYHLMRDEMLFKKDCGIKIGEVIKIELLDRAQNSGRQLKNTYIYKAEEYDDVAIKMVLKDFGIEEIKKDQ